jgi:hypothetical protein
MSTTDGHHNGHHEEELTTVQLSACAEIVLRVLSLRDAQGNPLTPTTEDLLEATGLSAWETVEALLELQTQGLIKHPSPRLRPFS